MRTYLLAAYVILLWTATVNAALIGYWDFEEQTGTSTVNLANPGVGDAVLKKAVDYGVYQTVDNLWATAFERNCIKLFEENFEFANVSDETTNITSNAFTITAMVYRQGGNMRAEPVFGKASTKYGMTIYDGASGTIHGYVYGYVDSANQGSPAGTAADDAWSQIAVAYDGSISGAHNLFIYGDGVLVGSKEITTSIPDTSGMDFRIGGNRADETSRDFWNSAYFNGYVDEVRLFDHALNATEMMDLYTLDSVAEVPEPGSIMLLVIGGACLAMMIRRRK